MAVAAVRGGAAAGRVLRLLALGAAIGWGAELRGDWQDPLSPEEIDIAAAAATIGPDARPRASIPDIVAGPAGHPLGRQTLLVELVERKRPEGRVERIAEVFAFDYRRGTAELSLVDVDRGLLVSRRDIAGVHLPLAPAEIDYSRSRAWSDAAVRRRIADEMAAHAIPGLDAVGEPDIAALRFKVSVWVPGGSERMGADGCERQRCALVSIFTADNHNFSIEPVINLMSDAMFTDPVR